MTINNIDVRQTIQRAQLLLEQEQNISETFKSILTLLFTLMQIILDNTSSNGNTVVDNLKAENIRLQEELSLMRQKLFGNKSEVAPGEPMAAIDTEPKQTITVLAHTREKGKKGRGRNIDTNLLPRYKIYHDLAADQQTCQCCSNALARIGQDVSEQLEVIPMLLYVTEHIRYKYACRKCQTLIMAPKPPAPLPKALAGGSLIADVVVSKFQYHLPLYRQSKIFASYDAEIPDNTLGNWVMQAGAKLMPLLLPLMWQAALSVCYLQADETPVKVQNPNKKGYLWAYFAPYVGKGLVIFEFSLTRSSTVAEERLVNFKGLLQTDGYAGYNNLRKRKNITGFGCLTHVRRKFSEVLKITKNSNGIAAEFVSRVKPLYELEEKMRALNVTFHTRKRLRQKYSWPILKALLPWLKVQFRKVPPKSKLATAIIYTLNQWQYITAYLRHGMAEIDTNWVENKIRPTALGKKNWLHMNNEDSGAVNAFWYSLISSAEMNGLNPRVYIHFLLMNIHELRRGLVQPVTLLPHTIDNVQLKKFSEEQLALAKKVLNSS